MIKTLDISPNKFPAIPLFFHSTSTTLACFLVSEHTKHIPASGVCVYLLMSLLGDSPVF